MVGSYLKVCGRGDVGVGQMKSFTVGGKQLLVVNIDGNYYVVSNVCTHAGGDLSKGRLDGNVVECPRHHARFDVITGKVVSKPKVGFLRPDIKDLKVYQVKVVDDDVMAVVE